MWKMFLLFWPLCNFRVPFPWGAFSLPQQGALVFVFLNDSLWNFPSNQCSKAKGSNSLLRAVPPNLSLRRGVSWGRPHTLEHWPCGVYSIWLSTCEMFWLNVYVSHKLTVYVSICIYPKESVFHFHLLPTFSWTIHLAWGLHCSACKSSHKTVFSQTFCPFLWDWERRDQRCSPIDTGTIILPTPPSISTWPGKACPVPEIGRLCFHCAFRGHTCTFLLSFDSLFCILDSKRSLHVEDSKLEFLINCLGLYLYWLLI